MVSLCQALVLNVGDTRIIKTKSLVLWRRHAKNRPNNTQNEKWNASKKTEHEKVIENIARFLQFLKVVNKVLEKNDN